MGTGDYVEVLGKEYHDPGCFVCAICKKDFPGGKYVAHEGKPVHNACIPKKQAEASKEPEDVCAECKKSIAPGTEFFKMRHEQGTDKVYHLRCIMCTDCKKPIGDAKYALCRGQPVHTACMHGAQKTDGAAQEFAEGTVCARCNEPIRGQKKTVPEFGSFHLTCFKCSRCNLGITKEFFKDDATGKPVCHRCK